MFPCFLAEVDSDEVDMLSENESLWSANSPGEESIAEDETALLACVGSLARLEEPPAPGEESIAEDEPALLPCVGSLVEIEDEYPGEKVFGEGEAAPLSCTGPLADVEDGLLDELPIAGDREYPSLVVVGDDAIKSTCIGYLVGVEEESAEEDCSSHVIEDEEKGASGSTAL